MKLLNFFRLKNAQTVDNLDTPEAIAAQKKIIKQKAFLKHIYIDFYQQLIQSIPDFKDKTKIIEIGTGGGFLKDLMPNVITTDILLAKNADLNCSAIKLPFHDNSIDAFIMINVLHHLPDTRCFLTEAQRCLKDRGKIVMVEPANTPWSSFIYRHFHHEPFDTQSGWTLEPGKPLSAANQALPWIVFTRDQNIFEQNFPNLLITRIDLHTPIRYILSGGVSFKQLIPTFCYPIIIFIEKCLWPLRKFCAMFMTIEITKHQNLVN